MRCPFHKGGQERRPSFGVNIHTGAARCWTCGQGWNLYTLLRDLGVPKDEIFEELRGLEIGEDTEADLAEESVLPESVLSAFDSCPLCMLRDGFNKELLHEYEVGWDRINKRVTFPVRDADGVLVGILGRNMQPGSLIRYVVYRDELGGLVPSNAKIDLHSHLWNFHRLRKEAKELGLTELVLVEGIKKALWLIQHGWTNTVALYGSVLSGKQKDLLKGLRIGKLVILTDGDEAGRKAAENIQLRLMGEWPLAIPEYPAGSTQPDALSTDVLLEMLNTPGRILPCLMK
jgi:DNA primase